MIAILAAAVAAWPPPGSSWPRLQTALAEIPAAAGGTVLQRAKNCHLRFRKSESWISGAPAAGTKLELYFDPPFLAAILHPEAPVDQMASWTIRDGKATPGNPVAVDLQTKPAPFNISPWTVCR